MPDIKGYRELTDIEVDLVNNLKDWEKQVDQLLRELGRDHVEDPAVGRWLSLARTHIETGLMFAVKSITRPTGGLGNHVPSSGFVRAAAPADPATAAGSDQGNAFRGAGAARLLPDAPSGSTGS